MDYSVFYRMCYAINQKYAGKKIVERLELLMIELRRGFYGKNRRKARAELFEILDDIMNLKYLRSFEGNGEELVERVTYHVIFLDVGIAPKSSIPHPLEPVCRAFLEDKGYLPRCAEEEYDEVLSPSAPVYERLRNISWE